MTIDALARFRLDALVGNDDVVPKLSHLVPLQLPETWTGRILTFDQALAKTGYAVFDLSKKGSFHVVVTGMLTQDPSDDGHEGSLRKAVALHRQFRNLMIDLKPQLIVHEMPPRGGGKMARPESSLMAAEAIRIAAEGLGIPVAMVGAQRAKKRWTGNGNATKAEVKGALQELLPDDIKFLKPWNVDIADAVAVGLVALEAL